MVKISGHGDEFYAEFDTLDGYAVVFDESLLAYCYAKLSADGQVLLSTGQPVHQARGEDLDLSKHLRITQTAIRRQVQDRRSAWNQQVPTAIQPLRRLRGPVKKALPHSPTIGSKVGLCLLIDFDDDPATITQAEIQSFCNGTNYTGFGNNGSIREYFADASGGKLDYRNVVTAYIRIPNSVRPKRWYDNPTRGGGEMANYLIRDALDILKALPNYQTEILPTFADLTTDENNEVVACNVFYAGLSCGVWGKGLWPHSFGLAIVGPQELWPGGKKINKYQVTNIGTELELGTFCHENGHMLCQFLDIYDYDYDSVGGAGVFCLMNSGGSGRNPVQPCAYLKAAAGWATLTDLMGTPAGTLTLSAEPGDLFNQFYLLNKPGIDSEYFLLECRHQSGRDLGLPASGVAVWHIDELGNRDDQRFDYNQFHWNYEVTLVAADNNWDFEQGRGANSRDLFFSGNMTAGYNNSFSDTSLPSARWWDGTPSSLVLTNFSAPGKIMTFDYRLLGAPTNEAPLIAYEPRSLLAGLGSDQTLMVTALGARPLAYQWYKDSAALAGQTGSSLTLPNLGLADLGAYCVVVSNSFGMATSHVANVSTVIEVGRSQFGSYNDVAAISGNYTYLTGKDDGSLILIDITDPANPKLASRLAIGATVGVAVSGQYAYVGGGANGFMVVDYSVPTIPRVIARCDTGGDTSRSCGPRTLRLRGRFHFRTGRHRYCRPALSAHHRQVRHDLKQSLLPGCLRQLCLCGLPARRAADH